MLADNQDHFDCDNDGPKIQQVPERKYKFLLYFIDYNFYINNMTKIKKKTL